jgi:2-oxoglutarate ferredoxin oxidoreductase subunit gamma
VRSVYRRCGTLIAYTCFIGDGAIYMREGNRERDWQERIIVAGFGGQGVVLMGKLLAYAGMLEGRNVTCLPSYGPRMRGGTANSMVTISTSRIGSPYVTNPTSLIAMNLPSLDFFESSVEPGGCVIVNRSLSLRELKRNDVVACSVEATRIAEELGDARASNMVAVGAFVKIRPVVRADSLIRALPKALSTRRKQMVSLDEQAIRRGGESVLKREASVNA